MTDLARGAKCGARASSGPLPRSEEPDAACTALDVNMDSEATTVKGRVNATFARKVGQ